MSVCQHMWVERCASEELSLCERVGGILYVFISILENLSEAVESDKEGEKPSEDVKCAFTLWLCFQSMLPPTLLPFLKWRHVRTLHLQLLCACCHLTTDPHGAHCIRSALHTSVVVHKCEPFR